MNILIITQYYWPENFRINELSLELSKAGNKVTVLTGFPNYPGGKIYEDFKKNKSIYSYYKAIKIIRIPIIPRGKNNITLFLNYLTFILSGSLLGPIKLCGYKFDLIFIFQTSPIFVGIPSRVISLIKKCPQIIWVLDLWPHTISDLGVLTKKWQLSFIEKISKYIYSKCDVILAQSKSIVKEIKKYKKNKVYYFPNWTESEFINSSNKLAKEIKIKKGILTIIFAGNIGKAQDFPSIIKAVEYLIDKNFNKFRIITIGEGSKKEWLIKKIKERKLSKYFEIFDQYPLARISSFLSHADALLVSLANKKVFNITIPGKMQTYLSSGVPILGMLNGEGASVIKESNSGYVCPAGDYKGLAKLIIKMSYLNKEEKNKLGKNGIYFAKKEFNKSLLLNNLQKLLEEIN